MKIAIFGATGMVGSRLVDEAMARGHEVTAVTRNGRAIPGTTAVAMDFTDTPAVVELANASDVVIISIPPDRSRVEPIEVNLHAHQRLIDAVPSARIIVVGGAGSLKVGGTYLRDRLGFPEAAMRNSTWGISMLERYQASPPALDWLVVSPSPLIEPGQRTGHYVLGIDEPAGQRVSAENFAVGILDEIEDPDHHRMRITFADK